MAIQDILTSLYGIYTPTGVYSFEFRTHSGKKITEVFFMLPPENISVKEPTFSELMPTLSGGYLVDFGQGFKPINISGSLHYYMVGSSKQPLALRHSNNEVSSSESIDGFTEFRKLRYALIRYRDYVMTEKGRKTLPPSGSTTELDSVKALDQYVRRVIKNNQSALYDQI